MSYSVAIIAELSSLGVHFETGGVNWSAPCRVIFGKPIPWRYIQHDVSDIGNVKASFSLKARGDDKYNPYIFDDINRKIRRQKPEGFFEEKKDILIMRYLREEGSPDSLSIFVFLSNFKFNVLSDFMKLNYSSPSKYLWITDIVDGFRQEVANEIDVPTREEFENGENYLHCGEFSVSIIEKSKEIEEYLSVER